MRSNFRSRLAVLIVCTALTIVSCGGPDPGTGPGGGDLAEPACSCTTGAKRCLGNQIQVCELTAPGCSSWGSKAECASGMCSGDSCGGTCQDACAAGAARCDGVSNRQVCHIGPSGCLVWSPESCPAQQYCDQSSQCVAAVACDAGCPAGYTCEPNGTCAGGSPTGLVFDVKTVRFAGTVTLNGASPLAVATYCSTTANSSGAKADVRLVETTKGYTFYATMLCKDSGFSFAQTIFPGTYQVAVTGDRDGSYNALSNLPTSYFVVDPALVIAADVTGKNLDVKTVRFAGSVTLNGASPAPVATYCSATADPSGTKADVRLVETTKGYTFYATMLCKDSGFSFAQTIFPGTYQVAVTGDRDGSYNALSNLPTDYFVVDPALVIAADVAGKTLDVKTVRFAGTVTLNGASPSPVATYCSTTADPSGVKADVRLVETTKGYTFYASMLCKDSGFSFAQTIFPGTYQVAVTGDRDGSYNALSNLPTSYFVVDPALVIAADVTGKNLDVKTVRFAGTVTLNGASPLAVTTYCSATADPSGTKADVRLVETTKGYTFYASMLCKDSGFSFAQTIFPGTYQVAVTGDRDGSYNALSNLPTTYFVVNPALVIAADVAGKNLDVKTVNFAGAVTLNGTSPTPVATYCSTSADPSGVKADVRLVETTQGYTFYASMLCKDSGFNFAQMIFPGTYQVAVTGDRDGSYNALSNLPTTYFVVDPALVLAADVTGKTLDVKTINIAGSVTLNGAPPVPVVTYCSATADPSGTKADVRLVEITQGYTFYASMLCKDSGFRFAQTIFPGTYQVAVTGDRDGSYNALSNLPTAYFVVASRLQLP